MSFASNVARRERDMAETQARIQEKLHGARGVRAFAWLMDLASGRTPGECTERLLARASA